MRQAHQVGVAERTGGTLRWIAVSLSVLCVLLFVFTAILLSGSDGGDKGTAAQRRIVFRGQAGRRTDVPPGQQRFATWAARASGGASSRLATDRESLAAAAAMPHPAYYINMEGSERRRQMMEANFGGIWDLRRVPAVDGHNDSQLQRGVAGDGPQAVRDMQTALAERGQQAAEDRLRKEVGATVSHLRAVERVATGPAPWALVMEDDMTAELLRTWRWPLQRLVDALPADWAVLRLSYGLYNAAKIRRLLAMWSGESALEDTVAWTQLFHSAWGANAYLLRREAATAFLGQPFITHNQRTGLHELVLEKFPEYPCVVRPG